MSGRLRLALRVTPPGRLDRTLRVLPALSMYRAEKKGQQTLAVTPNPEVEGSVLTGRFVVLKMPP